MKFNKLKFRDGNPYEAPEFQPMIIFNRGGRVYFESFLETSPQAKRWAKVNPKKYWCKDRDGERVIELPIGGTVVLPHQFYTVNSRDGSQIRLEHRSPKKL